MTHRTLCLIALLTVGAAGCQDSNIMDPMAGDPFGGSVQKAVPAPGQGEIPLAAVLKDPNSALSDFVYLSGLITYQFGYAGGQERALQTCKITIAGELWPLYQESCGWTVSGESLEEFTLGPSGSTTFSRSYDIRGRSDGVFLSVVYRATSQKLDLESVSLKELKARPRDGD